MSLTIFGKSRGELLFLEIAMLTIWKISIEKHQGLGFE